MPEAAQAASADVAVLIVHYDAYAALRRCLESLEACGSARRCCLVRDHSDDAEARAALVEDFPSVRFLAGENRGFAGGANALLAHPEAEAAAFSLLLNPDVTLREGFIEALVDAMIDDPMTALAAGKLLRSDGRTLDSAGIELPPNRRPRDRGSETLDDGRFDRAERVFGATGAAVLIRRAALADLAIDGEIFDEDFFVYHEDTDLSWRANSLGWSVRYVPAAVATHARGWQKADRFEVPAWVRRHSFKNHYLQLIKNESFAGFAAHFPAILAWEVLRLGFVLLRDREMLPAYRSALRLVPRMWRKRRTLQRRIAARQSAPLDRSGQRPPLSGGGRPAGLRANRSAELDRG